MRAHVKAVATQTLGSPRLPAARAAANVASTIALIELEKGMWPDLVPALLQNVSHPNVNLRITSLETLGYICDDIVREPPYAVPGVL